MILIKEELKGEYIHSRVFMGSDKDHLSLTGTLIMRRREWFSFWAIFNAGVQHLGYNDDSVQFPDAKPILEGVVEDESN